MSLTIQFKLIGVIGFLLFTNCSNQFEKELDQVEEMQLTLKGINNSFIAMDTSKIQVAFDAYNQNVTQIEKYYNPDTVIKENIDLLGVYKGVKSGAKSFSKDYEKLAQNIALMENQLNTLKNDIENNAQPKDSIKKFIIHEQKNLEIVQSNMGTLLYNYEHVLTIHDTLAPKVMSLLFENAEN